MSGAVLLLGWLVAASWAKEPEPPTDFTPVAYSNDLVSARPLALVTPKGRSGPGLYTRSPIRYYVWIDQADQKLQLQATGGMIKQYQSRGAAQFKLYVGNQPQGEPVSTASCPPDQQPHELELTATEPGLHCLVMDDQQVGTSMWWKAAAPLTRTATAAHPLWVPAGRASLCFYVPRGARIIGGYGSGIGQFIDSAGQAHEGLSRTTTGYFSIAVPEGQDGKLWRLDGFLGKLYLLTVPPYFAADANALLLPREVVEGAERTQHDASQ